MEKYQSMHKFMIRELVNKETPMKVINQKPYHKNIYICAKCKRAVHIDYEKHDDNYCSYCGQRLDWSDFE